MEDESKNINVKLRGKFYEENSYPEEDELVMVQCLSCEENGCYVELLQYEGKKGMIPINEFSKSMKKSIQRAMKIGKVEAVRCIRVDTEKGYIDLSKNKINVQEQNEAQDKYAKSKAVHSILMHISKHCKVELKDLYQQIAKPLYENESQLHPLEQLKILMIKEDKINQLKIQSQEVKKNLLEEIKRRFKRPVVKTMSVFKVSVRTFEGIYHIKEILTKGVKASKDKGYDVKITILGAPDYFCEVATPTKQDGQHALMTALNAIKQATKELHGQFEIKQKPKVVGDTYAKIQEILPIDEPVNDNSDEDSAMGDADDLDDQI